MEVMGNVAILWFLFVAYCFTVQVAGFFWEIRERRKEFDKMSPGWRDRK